jgi:hypothetical protein
VRRPSVSDSIAACSARIRSTSLAKLGASECRLDLRESARQRSTAAATKLLSRISRSSARRARVTEPPPALRTEAAVGTIGVPARGTGDSRLRFHDSFAPGGAARGCRPLAGDLSTAAEAALGAHGRVDLVGTNVVRSFLRSVGVLDCGCVVLRSRGCDASIPRGVPVGPDAACVAATGHYRLTSRLCAP